MTKMLEIKTCKQCNETLPRTLEYFYKHENNKDNLTGKCRTCIKEQRNKYKKENADLIHLRDRRYRLGLLGFTPELVEKMRNDQNNLCAICKTDDPGNKSKVWHSDHDHDTGKPRGLLCVKCNIALGHIEERGLEWLPIALEYIKAGGFHD